MSRADELRIAVASNFANTMAALTARFEQQSGHKVAMATGSTGKHYAQIMNGAPFDMFFAADVERPERMENEGLIVPGSRFTYAIGRLVLWNPLDVEDHATMDADILTTGDYQYLAIANPRLAPYGKAAQQVLKQKELWPRLQSRIVRGENIGQTFQFVKSGNAQLGFVALSQVNALEAHQQGSYWLIEQSLYDKIEQQAVLLKSTPATQAFMRYVQSQEARTIIRQNGYDVP